MQHPVIHFSIRLRASKFSSQKTNKNKKNNGKDQYYYYSTNASE
jgi:hypothetical protein